MLKNNNITWFYYIKFDTNMIFSCPTAPTLWFLVLHLQCYILIVSLNCSSFGHYRSYNAACRIFYTSALDENFLCWCTWLLEHAFQCISLIELDETVETWQIDGGRGKINPDEFSSDSASRHRKDSGSFSLFCLEHVYQVVTSEDGWNFCCPHAIPSAEEESVIVRSDRRVLLSITTQAPPWPM